MTRTQARRWAFAAAVAGLAADALFIAFDVGFAVQHFAEPYGVAVVLGSAAGALAWLSLPLWLVILGRATAQEPSSAREVCDDVIRPHP